MAFNQTYQYSQEDGGNWDDTGSATSAYSPEDYNAAGQWIAQNLSDPQAIAAQIQSLGLSQDDVLKAVQTQNSSFTLDNVNDWFSTYGLSPWEQTPAPTSAPTVSSPLTSAAAPTGQGYAQTSFDPVALNDILHPTYTTGGGGWDDEFVTHTTQSWDPVIIGQQGWDGGDVKYFDPILGGSDTAAKIASVLGFNAPATVSVGQGVDAYVAPNYDIARWMQNQGYTIETSPYARNEAGEIGNYVYARDKDGKILENTAQFIKYEPPGFIDQALEAAAMAAFNVMTGGAGSFITGAQAIDQGNVLGGLASMAGAAGIQLPPGVGEAARTAGQVMNFADAVQRGDWLSAVSSGMNLTGTETIGGLNARDFGAINNIIQGVENGDIGRLISGANNFINSPDLAIAGPAASIIQALESGNYAAAINAGVQLNGVLQQQSTAEAARIEAAYADPSRGQDVLGNQGAYDYTTPEVRAVEDALAADVDALAPTATYTEPTDLDVTNFMNQELESALTFDARSYSTKEQAAAAAIANNQDRFVWSDGRTYTVQPPTTSTTTSASTTSSSAPSGDTATVYTPQGQRTFALGDNLGTSSLEHRNQLEAIRQVSDIVDVTTLPAEALRWMASYVFLGDTANLRNAVNQWLATGQMPRSDKMTYDLMQKEGQVVGSDATQWQVIPPDPSLSMANVGYTEAGVPAMLGQVITVTGKYDPTTVGGAVDSINQAVSGIPIIGPAAGLVSQAAGEFGSAFVAAPVNWMFNLPPDSTVSRVFNEMSQAADVNTPDSVKEGRANWSQRVAEAEGVWGKFAAGVTGGIENPAALMWEISSEVLQELPNLGLGLAVKGTAKALDLAQRLSTKLGVTVATASDMIENGGAAYNDAVNRSLANLQADINSGKLTNEQALQIAQGNGAEAFLYGMGVTGAIASVPGGNALYKQVIGDAVETGARTLAGALTKGAVTGTVTGAKEAVSEGLEGGGTEAMTQGSVFGFDNLDPGAIGAAAGQELVVGGGTAGSIGSVDATIENILGLGDIGGTTGGTSTTPGAAGGAPGGALPTVTDATASTTTSGISSGLSLPDTGTALDPLDSLDTGQIIDDYVNEVLGGGPINTSNLTSNTVLAVDANGNNITAADIGLVPSADTIIGVDVNGNPVTQGDLDAATATTEVTPITVAGASTGPTTTSTGPITTGQNVNTASQITTDPNTQVTTNPNTQVTTDPNTQITTDPNTQITTDPNTQITTDPNTQVTTDPNTQVTTNPNTQVTTNPNTQVTTQVTTDPNTNITTQVTTDPNTNITTQVTTDPNTNITTQVTTDVATGVTITTETNVTTGETVVVDVNTNPTPTVQTPLPPTTDTSTGTPIVDLPPIMEVPVGATTPPTETTTPPTETTTPPRATTPPSRPPTLQLGLGAAGMLGTPGGKKPPPPSPLLLTSTGAIDVDILPELQQLGDQYNAIRDIDPGLLEVLIERGAFGDPETVNAIETVADAALNDSTGPDFDLIDDDDDDKDDELLMEFAQGGQVHPYARGGLPVFVTGGPTHYVTGPGSGQDDKIPAMLSDGEYVIDAETVAALGDGSNSEGARRLDEMRKAIRAHKRGAPRDKIPPKAKPPLSYVRKR